MTTLTDLTARRPRTCGVAIDATTAEPGPHLVLPHGTLAMSPSGQLEPISMWGSDQWWSPLWLDDPPAEESGGDVDPDRLADRLAIVPAMQRAGLLPPGASMVGPLTAWEAEEHDRGTLTWGDLASRVPPDAWAVAVVQPMVLVPTLDHAVAVGQGRPVVVAWHTHAELELALSCLSG